MRRSKAAGFGIALCAVVAFFAQNAYIRAQSLLRRPQPKVVEFQPSQSTETVIGVMGQVCRPGTYRFTAPPSLQFAIDAAGGLTASASPMIRLVRGQRVVQRVALHAAAADTLQSGDLVIIDGQSVEKKTTSPEDDPGVQLAFLGIADHPVIVKVHTEQARPEFIIQMLGQPNDVLRSMKVIRPPQRDAGAAFPGATRTQPALSDGTVLLFDRRQIDPHELRDLPEIIPCSLPEPDIGAYGVRRAYEERHGLELPPPPTSRPTLTDLPPPTVPQRTTRGETLTDDRLSARLSSSAQANAAPPPVTTLPFRRSSEPTSSRIAAAPPDAKGDSAPDAQEPLWDQIDSTTATSKADPKTKSKRTGNHRDAGSSQKAKSASLSVWQMLSILASAGLLLAFAVLLRSSQAKRSQLKKTTAPKPPVENISAAIPERRRPEPRAPLPTPHIPIQAFAPKENVAPTNATSPAAEVLALRQRRFAQLIHQELALIEEPLALPPGIIWSIKDAGQAAPQAKATSKSVPNAGRADAPAVRHVDPPHAIQGAGPHLRPVSEAPVERALRQLQGGRS